MLSHGLVSGALFLCVGVIYDRLHTREIDRYGGLSHQHAQICAVLHAVHHGERRPARNQRLCRRIPERWQALQGFELGRLGRDHRASSWARLYALSSIAASPSASRRTPMPPPCPISTIANGLMLAPIALGGAVDGRLSGKLPGADAQGCRALDRADRVASARGDSKLKAGKPANIACSMATSREKLPRMGAH
jgi:hypothetical protein